MTVIRYFGFMLTLIAKPGFTKPDAQEKLLQVKPFLPPAGIGRLREMHSDLSYLQVPHLQIQPIADGNIHKRYLCTELRHTSLAIIL